MIYLTQRKELFLGAAQKIKQTCIQVKNQNCVDWCEKIHKVITYMHIALMALLGAVMVFDLLGCVAAGLGNRAVLITYIVVSVIFMILLGIVMGGAGYLARITNDPNNEQVKGAKDFSQLTLDRFGLLLSELNKTENWNAKNASITIKQEYIDLYNQIVSGDPDSTIPPSTGPDTAERQVVKQVVEVTREHSELIYGAQNTINWIQTHMKCCGMMNYTDWREFSLEKTVKRLQNIPWLLILFQQSHTGSFRVWDQECVFRGGHRCFVPYSCCKNPGNYKCNEENEANGTDVKDHSQIYLSPCSDAMIDVLYYMALTVTLLLAGIIILIIASFVAAGCALKQLKGARHPHGARPTAISVGSTHSERSKLSVSEGGPAAKSKRKPEPESGSERSSSGPPRSTSKRSEKKPKPESGPPRSTSKRSKS